MNKTNLFLTAVIIVIVAMIICLLVKPLSGAEIFKVETFKKVANLCNKEDGICFSCYLIPSNATSQNYIQLKKSSGNKDIIIANYERYNKVNSLTFKGDSVVRLILEDTVSYIKSRDTIDVKF